MARIRRIKYHGDDVYYHLNSRTVGQEFFLGISEKNYLLKLINKYSSLYFIKLLGFCIMDNHFHLVIKSESYADFSNDEIEKKVAEFTNGKNLSHLKKLEIIDRLGDISYYMKSIKETFARWYNKKYNRTGYFWGSRFKSILLEKKAALTHCLAYIDLNPVRARIVNRPEDYQWSSIYARVNKTDISHILYFTGIFDEFQISFKKALLLYRKFLYAVGVIKKGIKGAISKATARDERGLNFKIPSPDKSLTKSRHFTHGCAIGSKEFVNKMYGKFAGKGIYKKDRKSYKTRIANDLMSLQRVREIS